MMTVLLTVNMSLSAPKCREREDDDQTKGDDSI